MILIISGTNRPKSKTQIIANYYKEKLVERGVECEILSLTELPPDIIVSDLYGKRSEAFQPIQDKVTKAEKFFFITPEYNGSIPGVMKVFIDACSFPMSFYHKKIALVGLSTGRYGNLRGVDHLTGICNYLRMHVLSLKIFLPNILSELDEHFQLKNEETKGFIQEQIDEMMTF